MNSFYFFLWLRWSIRVTLCSIFLAFIASSVLTGFIFLYRSSEYVLNDAILNALSELFLFWFIVFWNLTLLIALFRSIKYIFNTCIKAYELKLLSCPSKEVIEIIGYGDLIKVWRKWFMLLIWLVASLMILSLLLTYMFSDYTSLFDWFNVFWLYGYILVSGYFSFILLIAKCKKIEIRKC